GAGSLPEGQAAALAPGNVVPLFPTPAASPRGVAMAPSTGRSVAMAFDATEHPPVGSEKLKEVEDALKYIPANKGFSNITQNNSLWRQVRMALKSQGEAGWELFNAWSQTATDGSYREQECRSEWENGLGKSDSLGPIFAEAQKRGWINPNSNAAKPVQQVPQSPWQLPQPAKAKPKLGITMINSIEQTEVKWLVEGLIPADANIGIVGASSVGKTFVALALGLSAATGREFMGGEMHCVAPVIYLAGEGKHGIAKRCRAWATYYGISLENVPFAVADYLPPMTDEESVAMTIEAVQGIKDHYGHPALIIIDTLNRAFGDEDENSTAGMTKYISGIDRLRAAFPGCSTVTLHHTGHEAVGRARGSSAFYAALDTELFIKRSDPWIEIEVTKQKDAAKAPKMKAWLREQDVGEWGSSLVAVRDMSINREMQISMAVSSGISVRQCVENLKKEGINISKNTIMKLRQEYEAQRNLNGV
ncbi:AAA family ATPase, partial [Roseomonas mucosa]